jgi:hypothetical protein
MKDTISLMISKAENGNLGAAESLNLLVNSYNPKPDSRSLRNPPIISAEGLRLLGLAYSPTNTKGQIFKQNHVTALNLLNAAKEKGCEEAEQDIIELEQSMPTGNPLADSMEYESSPVGHLTGQ